MTATKEAPSLPAAESELTGGGVGATGEEVLAGGTYGVSVPTGG